MQTIYFTPGPSQLFPTVKKHLQTAMDEDIMSISHRSPLYHEMTKTVYDNLSQLLSIPSTHHIFFVASGTEAMERVIENCVDTSSFHFVSGAFSKRFYQISLDLKRNAQSATVPVGQPFDFSQITIPQETELICFTHNETSAGTAIPLDEVYALRKQYPEALFAIDIVSSGPYVDLDFQQLDCVFFSVQKGFGLPAGLGVLIVSPRAMEKAMERTKNGANVGSYHKFETMLAQAQKYQTIETPNVLGVYLLSRVLTDMNEIGISTIRKETEEKAGLLYDYFDQHKSLKPLVTEDRYRSQTVIVVDTPQGSKEIIGKLKAQGYVVGSGYGDLKEKQIRIANFPAHSLDNIKRLLSAFDEI